MNREIVVSLSFAFYPDTEHDFLFEEMTEEEIVKEARRMVSNDISTLVDNGDVYRMLDVSIN